MALGFNSNILNTQTSARSTETSGVIASSSETAGSVAMVETAGMIASAGQIDSYESSNPFATEVDYSQYTSAPETAGSLACETAGSIAFGDSETAGSLASAGAETAGSVASSDSGSFGSFDSGFVC